MSDVAGRSSSNQGGPAVTTPAARSPGGSVVLYDGVCGLCDRYVRFLLRHDRRGAFRFAPLQGRFAAAAVAGAAALQPGAAPATIVLLEAPGTPDQRLRVRSDAVLAILVGLGGPWRLAGILRLIPRPLRDGVYSLVARVRYRLFGKLDSCAVPPPSSDPQRFLA